MPGNCYLCSYNLGLFHHFKRLNESFVVFSLLLPLTFFIATSLLLFSLVLGYLPKGVLTR